MALPVAASAFPPKELAPAFDRMVEHDAWYSGDVRTLASIYSFDRPTYHVHKGEQRQGGVANAVVGTFARLFWGKPMKAGQARTTLHMPLAADVATMKSDMLWAEPAAFEAQTLTSSGLVPADKAVEARLDQMFNSPLAHMMLNEAGEIGSVLGGIYYRSAWNQQFRDYVYAEAVDADAAIPEWSGGDLVAVNFWTTYVRDDKYYRHFERHEKGAIIHALYLSQSVDNVGYAIPMDGLEETRQWVGMPNTISDGFSVVIPTGIQRLTVTYQPNVRKGREFRRAGGALAPLGRSDFEGVEQVYSALDEAWSSYMRDLKLARARIFVPDDLMSNQGPGQGATWDEEQEVFAQIKSLGALDKSQVTSVQPEIRWEPHERLILSLTKTLLRTAGLGSRDYDESGQGNQLTATGELQRNKREETTRDKAKRYATYALSEIASVNLELDALVFPGRGGAAGVTVGLEFPVESQSDPERDARTIGLLDAARAISLETKVKRANPEWTDKELEIEVEKLKEEYGSAADAMNKVPAAPDPTANNATL